MSTAILLSSISRRWSPTATSTPDSKGQTSPYNFKSHPAGLKALIDTGFNLFSLANNHAMDYGAYGAEEMLYDMAIAAAERAIAYAGIGASYEEATRPASRPAT
jgi:poly-gamma-glutamate synthesis protein (capsule biosynthesis protein)